MLHFVSVSPNVSAFCLPLLLQTDGQEQRDRPTTRNAHCSLGVCIDPANHFIYCLINADSHLFPCVGPDPDRSTHTWIKKRETYTGLKTSSVHTVIHTPTYRWTAVDQSERQVSAEERQEGSGAERRRHRERERCQETGRRLMTA